MKEFADDNFKLDVKWHKAFQMGRKNVLNGEIVFFEQFLLFPQYFQKKCNADT